jgi:hypothetical protein
LRRNGRDFPPPPQLPDLERVEVPEAPEGEDQEGWQVDEDLDGAAGNEGINDDTFIIRGNGNRVLDAGQLDPDNGEQVGGDQEVLAGQRQRSREADEGADDDGDQGGLARGEQDAQGQIVTGPGFHSWPGELSLPQSYPGSNWTQSHIVEDRTEERRGCSATALRNQVRQGELKVRRPADQDREEAHQQAKKLAAQAERARQLAEAKRIKKREADKRVKGDAKRGPEDGGEASGWALVAMRDDQGHMVYDQAGCVRYLPHNGPVTDQPRRKRSHHWDDQIHRHPRPRQWPPVLQRPGHLREQELPPTIYVIMYMGPTSTRTVLASSLYVTMIRVI